MTITVAILCIVFILLLISFCLFYKAFTIKNQKIEDLNKTQEQIKLIQQQISKQKDQLIILNNKRNILQNEIDSTIEEKRKNIELLYQDLKNSSSQAFSNYEQVLDKQYSKIEKEYKDKITNINNQILVYNNKLDQIKQTIQAASASKLIQQEEENKWKFYTLYLTEKQIHDITKLFVLKSQLYDPSLVGKIIWSAYILKAAGDLCNRVLGINKKCGIYKITNFHSGQIYIGQSVNISDRWKAHIKCGLGIDAPTTNKLYNNMQKWGVWMFTFELLQECSKEKLNERERFWINFYQSDKIGLNSNKGVSK